MRRWCSSRGMRERGCERLWTSCSRCWASSLLDRRWKDRKDSLLVDQDQSGSKESNTASEWLLTFSRVVSLSPPPLLSNFWRIELLKLLHLLEGCLAYFWPILPLLSWCVEFRSRWSRRSATTVTDPYSFFCREPIPSQKQQDGFHWLHSYANSFIFKRI